MTHLEHVNITVSDLDRTALMLQQVFGWRIRWRGGAIARGECIHVGGDASYVAVYRPPAGPVQGAQSTEERLRAIGLNHVGVVVEDLDAAEKRAVAAGLRPFNHGGYEPGRRFYFLDADGIEWEVIAYPTAAASLGLAPDAAG